MVVIKLNECAYFTLILNAEVPKSKWWDVCDYEGLTLFWLKPKQELLNISA